jgi:O-antigen/teichoic acid export membrane protein
VSKFTKSQMKKNIIFAALQIIVSGISLFILYKILLIEIGIELIGIWSIVMAFSAFLRTGDFGFAGSIVKFVSVNITKGEVEKVNDIVKTSITSVSVILGFLLVLFYLVIPFSLPYFISEKYIIQALDLLPYSIVSVWFAVLSTLIIFVFDGLNRVDIRSSFLLIFNLILVGLSIIFVYKFGFIGLGYAQVLHAFLQLIIAWFLVRKYLKINSILPFSWNYKLFKEMLSYSVNLQMSSLMSMMLEPVSKLLLGYFGTMSSVGYFEMANRLVMQIRNVVINANQAVVPMISKAHTENQSLEKTYYITLKILFLVSLCFYSITAILTSFVSELWIGYYEKDFIYFTYIILFSLAINTISGAAYFTNMAIGDVKYNTISQIIIAVVNIVLGILLGYMYKDYGIVFAYGIAITTGSLWVIYNFRSRLITKESYV